MLYLKWGSLIQNESKIQICIFTSIMADDKIYTKAVDAQIYNYKKVYKKA